MKRLICSVGVLMILFNGAVQANERHLETRVVWDSNCFADPSEATGNKAFFLAALAGLVAPKLISGAVDAAGSALKKAGERAELARSTANALTRPYLVTKEAALKLSDEHGCLVVARAEFPRSGKASGEPRGLNILSGLTSPVFILEAKVKTLPGEPFFQLIPVRVRVGKFEGSSFFGKNERDYSVALTLSAPGLEKPFASTVFSFEGLKEGADLKLDDWELSNKSSLPMSAPPIPESGKKAQAKQEGFLAPYLLAASVLTENANPQVADTGPTPAPSPYSSQNVQAAVKTLCSEIDIFNEAHLVKFAMNDDQCSRKVIDARTAVTKAVEKSLKEPSQLQWATATCRELTQTIDPDTQKKIISCDESVERPIEAKARFGYMTTSVTLVETRPGSKFAAYLGEALGASKDEVSKALTQKLVPSAAQALQDADDASSRSRKRAVLLADLDVTQAEQKLAELQVSSPLGSATTAAQVTLIKAKISANDAYRSADLPLPYPELY